MLSPSKIVHSRPKRDGESPEGYVLRSLEFASMHYTCGTLDLAIALTEREQQGKTGAAEDALSNVLIVLSEHKTMTAELYSRRLP